MDVSVYKKLQHNFVMIRFLHCGTVNDTESLNNAKSNLLMIRSVIEKEPNKNNHDLLVYCIDTLMEIIAENNPKKIFDFADTIHNIPEICFGKRNIYSFTKEILSFQKKYGKKYFPDFRKPKPKFQKKSPQNKWEYFFPKADDSFKYLHPIGYKLLCGVGIAVFLLPTVVYMVYTLAINPAPNEWTLILGQVGAFVVGIGFFNIVAAWIHQYLGHFFTVICIFGGSALTAFSLFLLYN